MDIDYPKFRIGYPKTSLPKLKPRGIQDLKKLDLEVFDSITPLVIFEQKPYQVLIVSLAGRRHDKNSRLRCKARAYISTTKKNT